jgi:hypothetical protein
MTADDARDITRRHNRSTTLRMLRSYVDTMIGKASAAGERKLVDPLSGYPYARTREDEDSIWAELIEDRYIVDHSVPLASMHHALSLGTATVVRW